MICRICGNKGVGINFNEWVKPTFTNLDQLYQGEIICNACLFWFNEKDENLAEIIGKDKPQRIRTYSHIIKNEKWTPYLKNQNQELFKQIVDFPFPELCVVADSGQKHLVFRAKRNMPGQINGFVQFEETSFFLEVQKFVEIYKFINELYQSFNREEIRTGQYPNMKKIIDFGFVKWKVLENEIKKHRNSNLFELALFFTKKEDDVNGLSSTNATTFKTVDDNMGIIECRL